MYYVRLLCIKKLIYWWQTPATALAWQAVPYLQVLAAEYLRFPDPSAGQLLPLLQVVRDTAQLLFRIPCLPCLSAVVLLCFQLPQVKLQHDLTDQGVPAELYACFAPSGIDPSVANATPHSISTRRCLCWTYKLSPVTNVCIVLYKSFARSEPREPVMARSISVYPGTLVPPDRTSRP